MLLNDFNKGIEKIENYYCKKIEEKEKKMLGNKLKEFNRIQFGQIIEMMFLKNTFWNTHSFAIIINEWLELENLKKQLGIESFDQLYWNPPLKEYWT